MWRFQYGYIFLSCGKEKKKSIVSLLIVIFSCFGPFWVWGVTIMVSELGYDSVDILIRK